MASAPPREVEAMRVKVLVVGGGPVGLFAAMELARHGISAVRVIDRKPTTTSESRALVTQARSLELLAHHGGLIDEYMRHGSIVKAIQMRTTDGSFIAKTSFLDANLDTKYTFASGVPQPQVERLMENYLCERYGIAVEHGVEFVSMATKEDEVEVTVKNVASGTDKTLRASFVIGCDGGRSAIRHALGLEFKGHPLPAVFLNVDVHIRTQYPGIAWGNEVLMMGEVLPAPTLQEVQAFIDSNAPFLKAKLYDPVWLSYFHSQQRKVAEHDYRPHPRVFIAGDAAHVHIPVGGWGMNLGFQDVNNLCWKLAIHIKKPTTLSMRGPLLNSYSRERSPVAEAVLHNSEGGLNALFSRPSALAYYLRRTMLPIVFGIRPIRCAIARMGTMIGISYPESPLHYASPRRHFITMLLDMLLSRPRPLAPGSRAPDGRITKLSGLEAVACSQVNTRVYDAIFATATGFCFLQFAGADRSRDYITYCALQTMVNELKGRYHSTNFVFHVIWPLGTEENMDTGNEIQHWLDETGEVFKRYGIADNFVLPRMVVVRPDRYIAGTFQDMNLDNAIAYFDCFLPH